MKKIKSITSYISFIADDGTESNEYKSSYQEFNPEQEMIKDIAFTLQGEIETASGYKFDEAGHKVEELHYLNETDVAEKLTITYETDGYIKEIETTYADGSKSLQKRIMHGHELFIKTYDENNVIEGEEIHTYDSEGNILSIIVFDDNKKIQQKFLYEYDKRGQMTSFSEYGNNEEFIIKKIYEYNTTGDPLKELHYSERGKLITAMISEYDKHGNLILQRKGDSLLSRFTYDDKKQKIKEETIDLSTDTVVAFKIYAYNEWGLQDETISYNMGQEYQMEPGLSVRGGSQRIKTKFRYEFFEP